MLFYWILFLIAMFMALLYARPRNTDSESQSWNLVWLLVVFALSVVIGLRHEVGGDWATYLPYLAETRWITLTESINAGDPAYALLNWMAAHYGGGIYLVNTICGALFSIGLISFCLKLPRPWLGLVTAIPYLVLVVAMGYSRQGVAIGIAMWGLSKLMNGNIKRFILAIVIAALFHKSAIILLLIALASRTKNKIFVGLASCGIAFGLYALLIADAIETLNLGYIESQYHSTGAAVRVMMNALPGLFFLLFRKRFRQSAQNKTLWTFMAWIALGFVGLLIVSPSSTAVDRLALYLIPLQLYVWSHFPDTIGTPLKKNILGVLIATAYSTVVLFIWLVFADHRHAWIPYTFYPFAILETLP